MLLVWMLWLTQPQPLAAAEVLQVAGPDRLLIGDRNRSSLVQLACIAVDPSRGEEARLWLRQRLPRHSRVNLNPLGEDDDGLLQARVTPLAGGASGEDLAMGLIAAGLAQAAPCS